MDLTEAKRFVEREKRVGSVHPHPGMVLNLVAEIERLQARLKPKMNCVLCHDCMRTRAADGDPCPWCEVKRLQGNLKREKAHREILWLSTLEGEVMPKTLEAGSELDARVAEEVMGLHLHTIADGSHRGVYWTRAPGPYAPCLWRADYRDPDEVPSDCARLTFCPSTDWAAAGEVLAKLREMWTEATDGVSGLDDDFPRPFDDTAFFSSLHRHADRRWPWAFLYATPLAICLAALEAVEGEAGGN